MPYLSIEISNNGPKYFNEITLYNYGVGPAIIESMHISYEGNTQEMDFSGLADMIIEEQDSIKILSSSSVDRGLAIPAGGKRILIRAGGSEKGYFNFLKLLDELDGKDFEYEIRYRSIYDDRWKITRLEEIPQAL